MTLWHQFQQWRSARLATRLVHKSMDVMLELAARQFSEQLTEDEQENLARRYVIWLCADDSRLLMLVDQPVRAIHLFISEAIQ